MNEHGVHLPTADLGCQVAQRVQLRALPVNAAGDDLNCGADRVAARDLFGALTIFRADHEHQRPDTVHACQSGEGPGCNSALAEREERLVDRCADAAA